ncbi:hypothetical protein AAK899_06140 [Erysipelotrichaceae bacterium 51-3]
MVKEESLSLTILPIFEKIQQIQKLPGQALQKNPNFFEKTKTDQLFCV